MTGGEITLNAHVASVATEGARGAHTRWWDALLHADVVVFDTLLALRVSKHGSAGEAAPVHPHLFRHARVRQIVRATRNLPLAQRQAGWSRLQMAYLTQGEEEARQLMRQLNN